MSVKRGAKSSVIELRDSLHWWARPQILSTHILAARSISSRRRSLWILAVFNVSTSESLQFSPFCKSYNWLFFGKKEGLQYLKNTTKMSHSNQSECKSFSFAQKSLCYKVRLLERFSTIVDRLCFVVGKLSLLILVLCREQGSKSFMICLLLFQLFMGSFSGLDDMLENEEANFGWWLLLWFVLFSSIFCSQAAWKSVIGHFHTCHFQMLKTYLHNVLAPLSFLL